jgi:gamma-glutamyltranspeptidase
MSPSIVIRPSDGKLLAVAGASGGPLIVSATLQTLARLLLLKAPLDEAVLGARVHDQLISAGGVSPALLENNTWGLVEWSVPSKTQAYLQQVGQRLTQLHASLGVSQAIAVEYSGEGLNGTGAGVLVGASDARKDGAPFPVP